MKEIFSSLPINFMKYLHDFGDLFKKIFLTNFKHPLFIESRAKITAK